MKKSIGLHLSMRWCHLKIPRIHSYMCEPHSYVKRHQQLNRTLHTTAKKYAVVNVVHLIIFRRVNWRKMAIKLESKRKMRDNAVFLKRKRKFPIFTLTSLFCASRPACSTNWTFLDDSYRFFVARQVKLFFCNFPSRRYHIGGYPSRILTRIAKYEAKKFLPFKKKFCTTFWKSVKSE